MYSAGESGNHKPELKLRFPALRRLESRAASGRVPVVQGLQVADCGAACLTMVLHYFGHYARLDEVQTRLGIGRDGVSALAILSAAQTFGLRSRAVRMELEDLRFVSPGAILHWRMNHFVVLERVMRNEVTVIDPALGRLTIPMKKVDKDFTGVALLFEPGDAFQELKRDVSPVRQYVRKMLIHSRLLSRILALSLFGQILGLALPVATGAIVDQVVPRADIQLLDVLGWSIFTVTVFSFLNVFIRQQLLLQLQTNFDLRLTFEFVEHLMRLPFGFFQARQTGDLMNRMNSNTAIRDILTSAALGGVLDGILVFCYLIVLLSLHAQFGVLILCLGAARVLVYVLARSRYRTLTSQGLQAQADASNFQLQMLEGIETLKAAGAERLAVMRWSHLFVDVVNLSLQTGRLNAVVSSFLAVLGTSSSLLLLYYGAHLVLGGELTLGTMLAISALAVGFLGPLSSLVTTGLSLQRLRSYADRVDDVLSAESEQAGGACPQAPSLGGGVDLEALTFRYRDAGPLVVNDVSLRIRPGTKVGICGRSGSGKSTLVRLMVGMFSPTSGRVLYDGQHMAEYDLPSLRRQVGFVPQNPYIFATTIRHNIALAHPDMPLSAVEDAARLAQLHDDIAQMPLGYDTPVTVGGSSLSGGQRQRLALARALAGGPAILLLDEATSHLDTITEAAVYRNLATLQCTCVVVAHRLSTIVDADMVVVMDAGRIAERGAHPELLAQDGLYSRLYEAQQGGAGHRPTHQ